MTNTNTKTLTRPAPNVKPPTDPPAWNGVANVEKYCAICVGMVNGNGCGAPVCPVRGK